MERDPETGKITRVVHAGGRDNPLNDPLNSESEDEDEDDEFEGFGEGREKNEIVRKLEEQANRGEEKRERKQSEREREWCQRLVERWGEDWRGMVRDRRLNPMQQTEGDLKRRIGKWRESQTQTLETEA